VYRKQGVRGEIKTKVQCKKIFRNGGEGEVSLQKKKERMVHLECLLFYYLSPETALLPLACSKGLIMVPGEWMDVPLG
jgi:hypothetical protein